MISFFNIKIRVTMVRKDSYDLKSKLIHKINTNRDSSLEYFENEPKNEPNYEIILAYEFGDPI